MHLCTTRLDLLKVNTARAIDPARAGRRRGARAAQRSRAARARPARAIRWSGARVSVASPGSRGTKRSTSSPSGIRAATAGSRRHLPHRARHHQRGVLRRAEGGAVHRHEQHRQRGPRVPRAVDRRAEGDDRRCRHDLLLPRRDRERPHRAVRRRRRERAAGVHEVPVPREEARREDRGRQPVPRARARALLGAVERRERDVRHEDDRRVLLDPHRRRRRVRQRRAQAAARDRRHRSSSSSAPTRTASTRCSKSSKTNRSIELETASGATRADMERFARMYAAARSAVLVWSMGITQHDARRRQRARDREPRPRARQCRAARAPDSCRSAVTPACRAAPRWVATRPRSRAACR